MTGAGRTTRLVLVAIGAALLACNLVGLVTHDRLDAPAIAKPASAQRAGSARELRKAAGEVDASYFPRMTRAIGARMTPFSRRQAGSDDRVPITENFLLHLAALVRQSYRDYEFSDYRRALRRGYGLCSQYATIVFALLEEQGYRPRRVLWPEHTVVEVRADDGRPWVIDSDIGVVLPHGVAELRRRPALIRAAYRGVEAAEVNLPRHWTGDQVAAWAWRFYDKPPTQIASSTPYERPPWLEDAAYALKWAVPIALLSAGLLVPLTWRRPGGVRSGGTARGAAARSAAS